MEEIKGCITDEEVLEVVKSIRKDIVPLFGHIEMAKEKILLRIILIEPKEQTKGGIITSVQSIEQAQTEGTRSYVTHPFQAVVLSAGRTYSGDNGCPLEPQFVPGDHVITKPIDVFNLRGVGVIIREHMLLASVYGGDIICTVGEDRSIEGPAKSTSDSELPPRKSELPDKDKGSKK